MMTKYFRFRLTHTSSFQKKRIVKWEKGFSISKRSAYEKYSARPSSMLVKMGECGHRRPCNHMSYGDSVVNWGRERERLYGPGVYIWRLA